MEPRLPHAANAHACLVVADGHDLVPGMRVRILDWEDLEVAYGLDRDGDIDCPGSMSFTQDMRPFCGATGLIVAMGAAANPDFRDGCTGERLEELAAGQPVRLVFDDAAMANLHAQLRCHFTAWMVENTRRAGDHTQMG